MRARCTSASFDEEMRSRDRREFVGAGLGIIFVVPPENLVQNPPYSHICAM